ncbi:MAG: hypothetical protein AW07_04469 [Candidatus Accumulibacter sp. SK-11]|nr:MAG: hypothetical protein AW07_04469 [Candidatus Accumulibacter sp. SK-11]
MRRTRVDEPQATQRRVAGSQHEDRSLAAAVDRHRTATVDGQRLVHDHRTRVDPGFRLQDRTGERGVDQFLQERQPGNAAGSRQRDLLVDAAPAGGGRRRHVAEALLAGIACRAATGAAAPQCRQRILGTAGCRHDDQGQAAGQSSGEQAAEHRPTPPFLHAPACAGSAAPAGGRA